MKSIFAQTLVSLFCSASILCAAPQGTAFTYQGVLADGTGPVNGFYVMQFALFDAVTNSSPIGAPIILGPIAVSDGLFHVQLDFGAAAFSGDARWLDISVRTNDPAITTFTTLHPRQPVTSQPYAIRAAHFSGSIADTQLSPNVALLDVPNTSAQATGTPQVTSGFITGASVTSGGSGYASPPTVTVNDTTGSGAVVTATVSGGQVTGLTVQNAGSGYSSGATLTIAPPPSNAYQVFTSTNFFTRANSLTNPANIIAGNGAGLTSLNAAQLTSGTVPAPALSNAWRIIGNSGTTPGTHFVGTTDNQPLEFRVNNLRALRLEPGGAPNLIGGGAGNVITPGRVGGVIGGGSIQNILADYGTIGGGQSNTVNEIHGTIGGGAFNRTAGGPASTVSGGFSNAAAGHYTVVAGGLRNTAIGYISALGGGQNNVIETNADHATIAGGLNNLIQQSSFRAVIGGGDANVIRTNGDFATIAGGYRNLINSNALYSAIGGGSGNIIGTNSAYSVIGGGAANSIASDSGISTVAGGTANGIGTNSADSAIGGGSNNNIGSDSGFGTIAGGGGNRIGTNSAYSAIGGGNNNNIAPNALLSTIAGGLANIIGTNSSSSTIGGGGGNDIGSASPYATIAGGNNNGIGRNSTYSSIGGGYFNDVGTNSAENTIGGGHDNNIGSNSDYNTIAGSFFNNVGTNSNRNAIGGGDNNTIGDNLDSSVIAGGRAGFIDDRSSFCVIGGGFSNDIFADSSSSIIAGGRGHEIGTNTLACVIGGGEGNVIARNSDYATIPGGFGNFATNRAFAAGSTARANHIGAFVWGDTSGVLASTNANSVTMRAAGGYRLFSTVGVGTFLAPGGGSWAAMSDRNAKENFEPVNPRAVLDKVAALPMTTWNYKTQSKEIRHIGPMAQDFKATFDVGEADTTITSIDADGVALAAIQGLNQKLQEELKRRDAENADLKQRLTRLEKLLLTPKSQ